MSNRTFTAHSSVGDLLEFRSLTGSEKISNLYEYRVQLLSESSSVPAKSLLGQDMTIEVDLTTEKFGSDKRFMSGQVTRFSFMGRDGDFFLYEAELRPWLWHATRRSDFKIFQFKNVPTIIKEVLGPYGFEIEDKLTSSYKNFDYIVQYGETDFNFVSRLMEMEGIYYYFSHSNGGHKLVLADDIGSHSNLPNGSSSIAYYSGNRAAHVHDEDFFDGFSLDEEIASGSFYADDYDFEKPKASLSTKQQLPAGHREDNREIYDWPGGYTELGDGENYAKVRIEQQKAPREIAHGEGNTRNIIPGYLFNLTNYPDSSKNKEYLVESVYYRFEENIRRTDGEGGGQSSNTSGGDTPTTYRIRFDAIPTSSGSYRSQRVTPKPHTTGPQTAVVTGPAGEEIYTDKYGRVKVQFHWDREGQYDENSSCWIRVNHSWAGSNYGTMHIPRIGQEVIVDFLNGDPDYPIIVGRVYNADQMPPWDLPANKTQSGIKTKSTLGGAPGAGLKDGAGDCNAIRFEDKKGCEQLWFHAQKDQLTEVENCEEKWVGNNRCKTIDNCEDNLIKNCRTVTVGVNQTTCIGVNQTTSIGCNFTITTGIIKLEVVGLAYIQAVGLLKAVNIGLLYNLNVGLVTLTTTGILRSDNVGVVWNRNIGVASVKIVGVKDATLVGSTRIKAVGGADVTAVGGARVIAVGGANARVIGAADLTVAGAMVGHIAGAASLTKAPIIAEIADSALLLKCGGSMIAMTPGAIIIKSGAVMIN